MTEYEDKVAGMTFEESMEALEALVKKLEDGGIGLDESLGIYENAVILRNHCRSILEDGERRIRKIKETADGIHEESFDAQRSLHHGPEGESAGTGPFLSVPVELGLQEVVVGECQPQGPS